MTTPTTPTERDARGHHLVAAELARTTPPADAQLVAAAAAVAAAKLNRWNHQTNSDRVRMGALSPDEYARTRARAVDAAGLHLVAVANALTDAAHAGLGTTAADRCLTDAAQLLTNAATLNAALQLDRF